MFTSTLENKFDEAAGKAKEVAGEVANDAAEDIEAGAKKLAERAKDALRGKGKKKVPIN